MKRKSLVATIIFTLVFLCAEAQKGQPILGEYLTKIIPELETQFNVELQYDSNSVKGLKVYATGGITNDFKQTFDDVFKPLGLIYKKIKPHTYLISEFELNHKRTVEEGKEQLQKLLTLYKNANQFNSRKKELRECMFNALGINPALKGKPLNSILRPVKKMEGYTVQNIAFESFPGYYVTGTLYKPTTGKGPFPTILCPHGHFYNETDRTISQDSGRYSPDMQMRCATLAKMGAVVLNYDMYSWGESVLESGSHSCHYDRFSLAVQTWNSIRCLDFIFSLPNIDKKRVGVTGASGGGTQTILLAALDDRVTASVPVVMVSSHFDGGCQCESGLPIHYCGRYQNNNVEIAAMMAPRAQLLISEDAEWTKTFPISDYPYLQKVYSLYHKKTAVENVHLHDKHHDYRYTKRAPMYEFFARVFGMHLDPLKTAAGKIREEVTIQNSSEMLVFPGGLPTDALRSDAEIRNAFYTFLHQ